MLLHLPSFLFSLPFSSFWLDLFLYGFDVKQNVRFSWIEGPVRLDSAKTVLFLWTMEETQILFLRLEGLLFFFLSLICRIDLFKTRPDSLRGKDEQGSNVYYLVARRYHMIVFCSFPNSRYYQYYHYCYKMKHLTSITENEKHVVCLLFSFLSSNAFYFSGRSAITRKRKRLFSLTRIAYTLYGQNP